MLEKGMGNMFPYQYLHLEVNNGVASMSVGVYSGNKSEKRTRGLQIIGSSMVLSVNTKPKDYVKSFSFELPNGENVGVIAASIIDNLGETNNIFIGVKKVDGKLQVLKNELFVPNPGRVGGIDNYGRITVAVGDIVYTNESPKSLNEPHPEYRLVDADNLCRYMVGLIDKDQLEKAAVNHIQALTQAEQINILKKENEDLNKRLCGIYDEWTHSKNQNIHFQNAVANFKKAIGEKKSIFFSGKLYKLSDEFFSEVAQ